jgi:exodeoxyribonuclease VII small subunit
VSENETTPAKDPESELSFREALGELEQILGRIEGDDVDLDALASELSRAAELLDVCRGKIRKAEVEVSHIVEKLEEDRSQD